MDTIKETYPKTVLHIGRSDDSRDEGAYFHRNETYRQHSLRTKAGLPQFSEQEDFLKNENAEVEAVMSRRSQRQLKLFWENFPLIMRNRDKILKYPILANIPIDSLKLTYATKGLTLGALIFAWGASEMRCVCPHCQGNAFYMLYTEMKYLWGPSCGNDWGEHEGEYEDLHYEDTSVFVRCSSCGEENSVSGVCGDILKTPRNLYSGFLWLIACWNHCRHHFDSKMSFEHAVHLLKLSEIYEEDPEDFLTGMTVPNRKSTPKKFSNVAATTEELINLVKGGKPYQLEEASKEELLNILHNYEKILDEHPETYEFGYDFKYVAAEDLSEEHLRELIVRHEEQLKTELLTIEQEI